MATAEYRQAMIGNPEVDFWPASDGYKPYTPQPVVDMDEPEDAAIATVQNDDSTIDDDEIVELDTSDASMELYLGNRELVNQVYRRCRAMMTIPDDTPKMIVWQFAQICTLHEFDPFIGEAYIIPLGKRQNVQRYGVHVGVKGLRKVARRQSKFQIAMRRMEEDEVKRYRAGDYHAEDVGYEATIYRFDVVRECKELHIPYLPPIAVGFWRKRAYRKKENNQWQWKEDEIPNTWTRDQVAEKRAEATVIKKAYDLEIYGHQPYIDGETVAEYIADHSDYPTERMLVAHEKGLDRHDALPADRDINREDDGNVLFA